MTALALIIIVYLAITSESLYFNSDIEVIAYLSHSFKHSFCSFMIKMAELSQSHLPSTPANTYSAEYHWSNAPEKWRYHSRLCSPIIFKALQIMLLIFFFFFFT